MLELGGSVLGFSSADSPSASKGESVSDTVRTVGCYADIIAMRHPKEGAPMAAAAKSPVAVINAGEDGGPYRHPHADAGGPADHPPRERTAGRVHHRLLRRPEIRPHGAFAHHGARAL